MNKFEVGDTDLLIEELEEELEATVGARIASHRYAAELLTKIAALKKGQLND